MSARRQLTILLAPLLALAALSLLLFSVASAAGIPAHEASLNPNGVAYEVNRDGAGILWISDDAASEIWQVDPLTGAYTVYQGLSHASDARRDSAGSVWWTDASADNNLGRVSLDAGTVTTWTLTSTGSTWGTAFDEAGHVWTTDYVDGNVFRFTPGTGELCTYPMPDAGTSDYLLVRSGAIWLGDKSHARIVMLDPAADEFTSWQLPAGAVPEGLALGGDDDVWWADNSRNELAHLEPGSDRVTVYVLPDGMVPVMLALDGGKVWFTSSISGTVGMVDPSVAAGAPSVVARTTVAVTPACRNLGAGTTSPVAKRTGTLAWSPSAYTRIPTSAGLAVYQMPDGAYPWGITTAAGQVWLVDQGRHVLARLDPSASPSYQIYLPMARKG